MNANFQFYIRTDRPQSDGSVQIYLVFNLTRKQRLKHATGKYVSLKPEYKGLSPTDILAINPLKRESLYCWDSNSQRATKGNNNLERLNYWLTSEEKKANDIILEHGIKSQVLTIYSFKKKFFKADGLQAFTPYFTNEIYNVRKSTLASNTKKGFKSVMNKIDLFKPGALLSDINHKFLSGFKEYLVGICHNSDVTVNKDLKRLRTLMKIAEANGDIEEEDYAFKNFKLKEENPELTNSDVVEPHELEILEKKYADYIPPDKPIHNYSPEEWRARNEDGFLSPGEQKTLRRFLSSCYTGLRFSDTCKLRKCMHVKETIVTDYSTKKSRKAFYLEMQMDKTLNNVTIPLTEKALALINETESDTDLIFEPISNQKVNEHLKSIAKKCGINKILTFHVSRHTFGTMGALAGINEKARQQLMGHKNGKFTKRYTHFTENQLFREMDKIYRTVMDKPYPRDQEVNLENVKEFIPLLQELKPEMMEQVKGIIKLLGSKAA
ncbi:MAG: tyrosine-type recombinase/integrase [Bacteroidia bacterium]